MGVGEWHTAKKVDRNQKSVVCQHNEFEFCFKIWYEGWKRKTERLNPDFYFRQRGEYCYCSLRWETQEKEPILWEVADIMNLVLGTWSKMPEAGVSNMQLENVHCLGKNFWTGDKDWVITEILLECSKKNSEINQYLWVEGKDERTRENLSSNRKVEKVEYPRH